VSVAVEVMVVVDEVVSAMASRGRRRAVASVAMRILKCVRRSEGLNVFPRWEGISTIMRCDEVWIGRQRLNTSTER